VAPDGSQTLVARALFRPTGRSRDVWQLHPNGWRFAEGHVPRLELLGADAPYSRPSNRPFTIDVEGLELRLPVRERPDCDVVRPAAAPVLPPSQELAPGVSREAAAGCGSGERRAAGDDAGDEDQQASDDGDPDAGGGAAPDTSATASGEARSRRLPFTGLALALLLAAAATLLTGGLILRRRTR
jgi:hypothetical protein